jgi:hypothetical protein
MIGEWTDRQSKVSKKQLLSEIAEWPLSAECKLTLSILCILLLHGLERGNRGSRQLLGLMWLLRRRRRQWRGRLLLGALPSASRSLASIAPALAGFYRIISIADHSSGQGLL